MLRILHTADWHLGQTLRGYSRDHEHAAVLEELIELVAAHQPNALLVAGDIFDSPNPSAESQRLFYRTLVQFHRACPTMTTVLTAGNHDAASRLEAPREIFASIGVRVVGNVRRQEGATLAAPHLIPIASPQGEVLAHVLALSYPTSSCLPSIPTPEGQSRLIHSLQHLYTDLVEQTRPQWQNKPLILTGHLHVSGAQQSEGAERGILIGGENAFPASLFPSEASYVALGHLHKPQRAGADHIRYSGSILPLSASEIDYKHGVTLVEIDNAQLRTQHLPLTRPVSFHRIPDKGFASVNEIPGLFDAVKTATGQRPFAQVRLRREGLTAVFREQLAQEAEKAGLRLVDTRIEDLEPTSNTPIETRTIADFDPAHFFQLAYQRSYGQPPTDAHLTVFQLAHEIAQGQ
ncbi:exonuclease subunit SbcD [Bryobacter aggregatus]|uniref:exonuclease subunit SbcD n=1 Tax=Bryobacter aggregatus TaxID=360054 RepID=UPI0004E21B72|nr:exonuclease subunit SbcD [Bryobacter aggregatus]